jgi:heptaprenyl diphosphate synthase
MRKATDRTDIIAFLSALALFLSSLEYMIPKPLPFLRLGIANLPVLIALGLLSPGEVLLLVIIKIVAQGFIQGTLFSYIFLFSLAGGLASGIIMIVLHLLLRNHVSLLGISIMGAFSSNLIQLLLASVIVWGPGVFIIAPPFLVVGTISAAMLGLLAASFIKKSRWIKELAG